ncbi:MAG: CdaR family protein [Terriglobia bacterium]
MSWLRQLLLHNWWLKLLALALAYALWWVVMRGPVVEMGMWAPLELRNVPVGMQVRGEFPSPVYLHLRGPERRLHTLEPEKLGVVVDLSEATAGNYQFKLERENVEVPPGIEVVRIIPEEVRLQLARR